MLIDNWFVSYAWWLYLIRRCLCDVVFVSLSSYCWGGKRHHVGTLVACTGSGAGSTLPYTIHSAWMGQLMVGASTCSCLYICTCIHLSYTLRTLLICDLFLSISCSIRFRMGTGRRKTCPELVVGFCKLSAPDENFCFPLKTSTTWTIYIYTYIDIPTATQTHRESL